MNPIASLLNPLEKLITEHGSAAIQTKHIALLKEQFSIIEKENTTFTAQIIKLEKQIALCKSEKKALNKENDKLRDQIKSYQNSNRPFKDIPTDYDPLTYGLK